MWSVTRVSGPTAEPLSVPEAKQWLRLDHAVEDALVQSLVVAAQERVERSGLCLGEQTFDLRLDRFPIVIQLPRAPVTGVTSITYIDTDGNSQTLASGLYQVDRFKWPARVMPAYSESWPATRLVFNAVTVRFTAGYDLDGATPDLPEETLNALRIALWDAYWHRDEPGKLEAAVNRALDNVVFY